MVLAIRLMAVGISAIAALSLRPYEAFRRDCGKHSSATGPSPGAQCAVGEGDITGSPQGLDVWNVVFFTCVCVYFVCVCTLRINIYI